MDVRDLKPEAQKQMAINILSQIKDYVEKTTYQEDIESILIDLVDMLDEQSSSDFWGTEGWEHSFGFED